MTPDKLFSADDRIIEKPMVCQDRVAARFQGRARQVGEEGGCDPWGYEEQRSLTIGLSEMARAPMEERDREPLRRPDMRRFCCDTGARVNDMLSNGTAASLCFASVPKFGGSLFATFKDRTLAVACVTACKGFVLDEWCPAGAADLCLPMIIVHPWDQDASACETGHCAHCSARAITLPNNSPTLGLPSLCSDHRDPLSRACGAADITIRMHIELGAEGWDLPPRSLEFSEWLVIAITASLTLMVGQGCRKPLARKIVSPEDGIDRRLSARERADHQFKHHSLWAEITSDPLPSEICRRNFWVGLVEEPVGFGRWRDNAIDPIVRQINYPHVKTSWSHTRQVVDAMFRSASKVEADAIPFGSAETPLRGRCVEAPFWARALEVA